MDDQLTLFEVLTLAWGLLAIVAGAIYVFWQIWHERRLARVQTYLQLAQQYDSEEFNKRRARFARQLLDDRESVEIDDFVLVFFEGVGYLLRPRLLDKKLLVHLFGLDAPAYYAASELYIKSMRDRFGDGTLYMNFENLAKRLDKYCTKKYKTNTISYLKFDGNTIRFLQLESRRFLEEQDSTLDRNILPNVTGVDPSSIQIAPKKRTPEKEPPVEKELD